MYFPAIYISNRSTCFSLCQVKSFRGIVSFLRIQINGASAAFWASALRQAPIDRQISGERESLWRKSYFHLSVQAIRCGMCSCIMSPPARNTHHIYLPAASRVTISCDDRRQPLLSKVIRTFLYFTFLLLLCGSICLDFTIHVRFTWNVSSSNGETEILSESCHAAVTVMAVHPYFLFLVHLLLLFLHSFRCCCCCCAVVIIINIIIHLTKHITEMTEESGKNNKFETKTNTKLI